MSSTGAFSLPRSHELEFRHRNRGHLPCLPSVKKCVASGESGQSGASSALTTHHSGVHCGVCRLVPLRQHNAASLLLSSVSARRWPKRGKRREGKERRRRHGRDLKLAVAAGRIRQAKGTPMRHEVTANELPIDAQCRRLLRWSFERQPWCNRYAAGSDSVTPCQHLSTALGKSRPLNAISAQL